MKAKNLFIIFTSLVGLYSCGQSNEDKAQQMAADFLKGVLYHSDSYVPLQTNIDSAFVSLSSDKEAIDLTLDMIKLFPLGEEYAVNIENAQRSMDMCVATGLSSKYIQNEYNQAKKELEKNQQLLDRLKERICIEFDKIKARQSEINTGEFRGWKVYHKFKSLNGAGSIELLGEYVFFCDENFEEYQAYPKEDFETISKLMPAIIESNDITEAIEKLQYVVL